MNQITYKIQGTAENDRHLDLSVLAAKFAQFRRFLDASAKELGADDAAFRVVALSHSSPVSITCEPLKSGALSAAKIARGVKENLNAAGAGRAARLPAPVLSAFNALVRSDPKKIAGGEIQVVNGGKKPFVYKLDEEFRAVLKKSRKDLVCISTASGELRQVDIRGKKWRFKLYDFGHVTDCEFPEEMLAQVQKALGRYVEVYGDCRFRGGRGFAYKAKVERMRIFPPKEEQVTFADIRGIAPGMTGGKSSVEFVRESRAAWGKRERERMGGK